MILATIITSLRGGGKTVRFTSNAINRVMTRHSKASLDILDKGNCIHIGLLSLAVLNRDGTPGVFPRSMVGPKTSSRIRSSDNEIKVMTR